MSSRSEKWIIHQKVNGLWDLSKNVTLFYSDMPSKAAAFGKLRLHYVKGQRIFVESPDGERLNVTEQLRKGGFL